MVILIDRKKERNVIYNIIIKQSIVIREIKKVGVVLVVLLVLWFILH
jgi:hypothetical protein